MIVGRDLKPRTFSALVLVPVALATTWLGGALFLLVWALAGFGVLCEWSAVARVVPRGAYLAIGAIVLAGAALALAAGQGLLAPGVVGLGMLVCAAVLRAHRVWAALGLFTAAAVAVPVVVLRGDGPAGLVAVFYLFAVVWGTDIAAYFTGRALGGPKLWPRLSPNKTWSGAIGGMVFGTLAGVALAGAAGFAFSFGLVAVGLVLSIVAQAGDLAESAFKRVFGVKDAGWLIPGHGGILDRLDGFAAAALLALLIALVRSASMPAAGLLLW